MSTIRDVAHRAGVSTMTISRVINRNGYVRPETQRRVERVVCRFVCKVDFRSGVENKLTQH